ncbi:MAG: hypothetical protein H6558_00300 [Lewinellaceae bacterium]|nr:hypothetical protein [Lewinellaceae bacterium]
MNKFTVFLLVVGGVLAFSDVRGQNLAGKSKRIFDLAHEGYLREDPVLLLDAIDLLLKYPGIRKFDGDSEKPPSAKSYFDPKTLFEDADQLTPFDAKKKLKKRLKSTRKKVARFDYETMGTGSSYSRVENDNYFIPPNKEWSSKRDYGQDNIYISIREGGGLKLAIYDGLGNLLRKDYSESEEKKIFLILKKKEPIEIVIENLSAEAIDAHLMVEIN